MALITRSNLKAATVCLTMLVNRSSYFQPFVRRGSRLLATVSSVQTENTRNEPFRKLEDIPGPVKLPFFGSSWIYLVGAIAAGEPVGKQFLPIEVNLANKYGRIFKMEFPGVKAIQLSDPCDVEKVLRSEAKYPSRLKSPVFDYYREIRSKVPGVFFAEGAEWYKHRSVMSKRILRPQEVAYYAPAFNEIVTDFIRRLRSVREPLGSEKENEVHDLDQELFKWSFESVAELLFDKRFGCLGSEPNMEAQEFIQAVGLFLTNAVNVGFAPVWFFKIYETQAFKDFVKNFDTLYYYAELFTNRRIRELEQQENMEATESETTQNNKKVGFFEFLLASGKLTKNDLLASVVDLIFAGVDTTSNTMQWVLYMMAKNPVKQNILRQEVLSVLGEKEQASPETLAKMPYLKACVRETLRLYPALATIPKRTGKDMVLSGYLVPAGTQVGCLTHVMGRDEKIFSDAGSFKPERWLRNNNDNALKDAVDAFASIPFGFGTRMCVGRRIAELELHLLLARIMQQFEIHYPPDGDEIKPFMRGVLIPDRPVRVKFVDRQK